MNPEQQEVAKLIRSGQYYEDAKSWYQALYIGPISERAFFIVILALSVMVCLVSVTALFGLLPLQDRPGVLIRNPRVDDSTPAIGRVRQEGMNLADSMEQQMVLQYVQAREAYNAREYARNSAFIRAHSDPTTASQWWSLYDPKNPRSPASVLGTLGQRSVVFSGVSVNKHSEPRVATVKFSTELSGVGRSAKTQWTATMGYYYSPMQITDGENAEGEAIINVEDPQFQVVNYVVTQTP